ncbi:MULTISPECIES: hypothetical protein [Herbaspirillum]|jgi:hypothetical protein|uniref:DUF4148 domain-containing protein n=1 Tax=Herbaspirillum rubrisubalbicans Os34 TaxID=1235827 RepID=A0A6M3ZWT5_9BURK|nr:MULTISPECIES: hypothetical protein [Herbaspirillum]NQE50304.1 hypothetical protein [Herbaspirillum rubrisubalbicans]QJQ03016.1 hypothetical protein C798_23145 [Herbaspirillum rubrisubalbicans Os34]
MKTQFARQLAVTTALSLATFTAQFAYAADTAPTSAPAKSEAVTTVATAATGKTGLTRAQVLEDLKQYQRAHANPSYAELVFLR